MIPNTKYQILNTKIKGFTLIEALVFLFIFSLITVTFYSVLSQGTRYIQFSKNRLGAVALANEKMEIIRNLKYEDVGTVGGIVSGSLPQQEEVSENGKKFTVHTLVEYEDDPFDGVLGGSPSDLAYKDYKTAKVTVSWSNGSDAEGKVEIISRCVPRGLEVVSSGDGILAINVFSDQPGGGFVPQARVHLVNSDVGINETLETDDTGNITLVGAKESISRYQLTVSKDDYETITTFPPYPDTAYNPINVHASVIGGLQNRIDIVQNKLANLKISTMDYQNNPISGVDFKLFGGRKLGNEISPPYGSIYNMNVTDTTDSSGEKKYNDISPGQYSFALSSSEDTYVLTGLSETSPFSLVAESDMNVTARVARKDMTSLLVKILRSTDGTPIAGARVRAVNSSLSYDKEVTTLGDGLAFFPISSDSPMEAGNYDISVQADGFSNFNGQANIHSGALLIMDEVILN